jgi:PLD-like domain
MRYYNKKKELKLFALTGTQTVLLSIDIAQSKVEGKDFLGFDIMRADKNGKNPLSLNGSKHFQSLLNDITLKDDQRYLSLVQSFYWKDYLADPGKSYKYTVKAIFGTPLQHTVKYETTINVTTEALHDGKHGVYFNFGVTGSQGFAKRFPGVKKIDALTGQKRKELYAYLGRELWEEGLLKFVRQAKGAKYQLYGAFYELEYPDFLAELKAAKASGAHVEFTYSAKNDQLETNEAAIKKAGLMSVAHPRTKVSQPHNKFMVLCKNNAPIEVWTGSTNLTIRGIFGHCNTGHWIKDSAIAKKYMTYWTLLKANPSKPDIAAVSTAVQPDVDLRTLKKGMYTFFSPRPDTTHLQNYVDLIDGAKELVCMIFPFNIEDAFKTVYARDKDYLRLLLFEKAAEAKKVSSNDIDLKITAGAVLDHPVEEWVKEITSSATTGAGIRYVHNKFFIIDALSAQPVVLSGSANFSDESITLNDENTLIVKGDLRVADIYLSEFNRLFEHFWPRYLTKLNKKGDKYIGKPLDEGYTWFSEYFNKEKFVYKRKELFKKMKGAKEG